MEEIIRLYQEMGFEKAIELANTLLEKDIDNWQALLYIGLCKVGKSTYFNVELEDALDKVEKAIDILVKLDMDKEEKKASVLECVSLFLNETAVYQKRVESFFLEGSASKDMLDAYRTIMAICVKTGSSMIEACEKIDCQKSDPTYLMALKQTVLFLEKRCKPMKYEHDYGKAVTQKMGYVEEEIRVACVKQFDSLLEKIKQAEPDFCPETDIVRQQNQPMEEIVVDHPPKTKEEASFLQKLKALFQHK